MRRRFRHRPRRTLLPRPCPPWCTETHLDDTCDERLRVHNRHLGADVDLVCADDLTTGTRTATQIWVAQVYVASPAAARALALAVLEGADHLEDPAS